MVLRADTGIAQGFASYEAPSTARLRNPSHAFPQTQGDASVEKALRFLAGVQPNERVFLFLVHETPMFALQVMRTLADRVRELNERI